MFFFIHFYTIHMLNIFQNMKFLPGFYQINWSALKYDFWQGGERGLANFWFFLTRGGGGVRQFLIFGWQGGEAGSGPPPIFGWHNMWTAPNKKCIFVNFISCTVLRPGKSGTWCEHRKWKFRSDSTMTKPVTNLP